MLQYLIRSPLLYRIIILTFHIAVYCSCSGGRIRTSGHQTTKLACYHCTTPRCSRHFGLPRSLCYADLVYSCFMAPVVGLRALNVYCHLSPSAAVYVSTTDTRHLGSMNPGSVSSSGVSRTAYSSRITPSSSSIGFSAPLFAKSCNESLYVLAAI